MQTQGASSLWGGGNSNLNGIESNWGIGTPYSSSGANNMNLLGYGSTSLSNSQGHMQSGASNSTVGDSLGVTRGGWGAPGSVPPSQSTNRMPPVSSGGNMQGNLPVSGAQPNGPQSTSQQSTLVTSSQSPGPNNVPVSSSQGNSAFGNMNSNNMGFQKISTGNTGSGLVMNPGTSIMNSSATSNSASQNSDNTAGSGWGTPITSDNSRFTGSTSWGNPSGGGDWDQSPNITVSQSQMPPSTSQFQATNSTAPPTQTPNPSEQRPSSWAQAAGKGLNLHSNNPAAGASGPSPEELERQSELRRAIESHEGWGMKPVNQHTQWSIETSPKVQRKFSTASVVPDQQKGTNNMWNNNNGTAIWEANKDNMSAWNSGAAVARPTGQPPSNWSAPPQQKPPDPTTGGQWGGVGGQVPAPGPNPQASWGGAPDPGVGGNPPNNWGGSTETGSWMANVQGANAGNNSAEGISTWDGSSGWQAGGNPRSAGGANDGTSYWGDAAQVKPPVSQQPPAHQQQPPNWNPQVGPPAPQAIGQRPKPGNDWNQPNKTAASGWGEISGQGDSKVDTGTGHWSANNQQQPPKDIKWGGGDAQWNSAIGKAKPSMNQNPAQFGGVDELNWNIPKEDVWSEESMGGWDDADMGTWNDNAQQTNSSWNSATGWNKDKRNNLKDGAMANMKFPGGGHPPQMRSRLLQQLLDMGFKRDEAQQALITNNLNLQNAIVELYNRQTGFGGKKDGGDMDMFPDRSKMRSLLPDGGAQEDISDTQSDSNSYVPNVNPMQNTPFNAQSKLPNQYPYNNGPSLSQSSLNGNNPSINNALQQKLIQKFHNTQQPPPPPTQSLNSMSNPSSQGVPMSGRGALPPGNHGNQPPTQVHQQMAQQQILQQLRMAVQAGLISPQLLNQQLPGPVLVMLQQLLQQQQNLQQLITTQQMLQTPKVGINPLVQRQQLEQVVSRINSIKQQILMLQKNISQAQNSMLNSKTTVPPQQQQQQHPQQQQQQSAADLGEASLQSELSNLNIATSQPQSRLNQWKRSTPDKESPEEPSASGEATTTTATSSASDGDNSDPGGALNKTVGSKSIQQSSSTPNLRRYDELGLSHLGGDTTWSTTPASTATSSWPNTSSPSSTASQGGPGGELAESKESPLSASAVPTSGSSVLDTMAIPEFVPGKPWQGISKNVEDDPHITPGSFSRSLSVNTIKDDYLLTLTKSSPTNETTGSSWPAKPFSSTSNSGSKPWSAGADSGIPSNFSTEVWGLPMSKNNMSRPPPGLPQQKGGWSSGGGAGMGRQHSWAGTTRSDGQWDRGSGVLSTALVLKNLTPQIDGSTLRTLCMQHGPLQYFYLNQAHGQALVKYNIKEEAMKAQKSLNTCVLGNTTIVAEFVSDSEAQRIIEQQSGMSQPSQWSQGGGQQQQQVRQQSAAPGSQRQDMGWGAPPTSAGGLQGGALWGNNMGGNAGAGSGNSGVIWEGLEDNAHNLLGNIMG